METMPSTSSSPVNLSSSAIGGCSKTRKSFLIDSLLDSILERKKASSKFVLRKDLNSVEPPDSSHEQEFELKTKDCVDENLGGIILSSSKTCLPCIISCEQNQPMPSAAPSPMDDCAGAPPSDPSHSTPNSNDRLHICTSKLNFFPSTPNQNPNLTAFSSLFNRFGGFPSASQNMVPFNLSLQQQQLEHLHRLRILQSTFGLAPVNQDLISNLQKSVLVQQQVLATTALRHKMAAAMVQQAVVSSSSKIESAHKKLLAKQLSHKPTAIATSLGAFREVLVASSSVKQNKLGGKVKGIRVSPPSVSPFASNSTNAASAGGNMKFAVVLNGRREAGRRSNGSAPRSSNVKKYRCDICEKTFSRSNTLITHKRIHTGEKPFQCEHCGRAFRQPGNLTRHAYTHTTVKPFVCPECGKAFNRASNLHTHQRVHFQQSGSEDN